jgi:hypothetical protein
MKRILLFLTLLLFPSAAFSQGIPMGPVFAHTGGGGIAFVQGNQCTATASFQTMDCAFPGNVTANHLLVLVFRWDDSTAHNGPFTPTVSTSAGTGCTTWSLAVPKKQAGSGGNVEYAEEVAYCVATASAAETARFDVGSSNPTYGQMAVMEYSGTATTSPLDVYASNSILAGSTSSACTSTATAALAQTNELVIGGCYTWDVSQTWGAVASWTNRTTASNDSAGMYDESPSATTAQTFSYTLSGVDKWASFIVAFKHL